jgi:hypothetical protein
MKKHTRRVRSRQAKSRALFDLFDWRQARHLAASMTVRAVVGLAQVPLHLAALIVELAGLNIEGPDYA